ncbi:hypothetical protein GGR51DRAFT_559780 [Nemania sp. FL0031]|nr:hypothetical protein GGR51DRAFT_559780 [Nemania sp. FL0031]
MAIHPDVPGIEATVRCAGLPLPEHEDPDGHENDDVPACPSATKYIECVDDAEFDICIKVGPTYSWGYRNHILIANTFVDGKRVVGMVIRSKYATADGYSTTLIQGQETYSIDDAQKERLEEDIKLAKGLGTIEVKFTRAIQHGDRYRKSPGHESISGALELAEKSLKGKAVSHSTSYGAKKAINPPHSVHAPDIPEDNGPILILKFMYRSRDALKRELIIPRSPSRSPTFENLSQVERDRLARERLNDLRERKVKQEGKKPCIKFEFGEVVDLTEDPPAPRPTKKARLDDGREVNVVDLTDD